MTDTSANQPSRTVPDLPLDRLNFLHSTAPPSLKPIVQSLRQIHSAAPPSSDTFKDLSDKHINHILLANQVAELTDEHPDLTRGIVAEGHGLKDTRDVARNFSHKKMAAMVAEGGTASQPEKRRAVDVNMPSEGTAGAPAASPAPVIEVQRKLFHEHPSAVVTRMVEDGEIHLGGPVATAPPPGPPGQVPPAAEGATPAPPETANPVKEGVVEFLDANSDFNLRQKSVAAHLAENPHDLDPPVVKALKTLQTMQALTHTPEALPALSKAGMTSAFQVVQMPEKAFVSAMSDQVGGEEVARAIHTHATNVTIRNDMALTTILQTARGAGIAMIDDPGTRAERIGMVKDIAASIPERVDLETLFGTMDVCVCDDCNSVTSPAAYFVELLQFLRNNNLDPFSPFMSQVGVNNPGDPSTKGIPGIQDSTPLGVLLARRPDLADLELTCANTNTVLPYIDLANEVMESFVVHLADYTAAADPKKVVLEIFNADTDTEGLGGSSPELLAQPQNTNMNAYCILQQAVYPSTKLPFNQPAEAIRLFLKFLGTNRADLGERFRGQYVPATMTVADASNPTSSFASCPPPAKGDRKKKKPVYNRKKLAYEDSIGGYGSSSSSSSSYSSSSSDSDSDGDGCPTPTTTATGPTAAGTPISAADQKVLSDLHTQALNRANDAERLLLTEEEYIILTKEAFWAKHHFEIRHGAAIDDKTYQKRIGVRDDWVYWGVDYGKADDMQDQTAGTGLTFVKNQFLPRTGILYSDLVDLLRTEFINPYMPKGRDDVIMDAFRLSYKFMKSLVGPGKGKERFWPLVCFIDSPAWHWELEKEKAPDVMAFFDEQEGEGKEKKEKKKCRHHFGRHCTCKRRKRILKWLCLNFDRMGQITVLESLLDTLHLPWEPYLIVPDDNNVIPGVHLAATATVQPAAAGAVLAGPADTIQGLPEGMKAIGKVATDGKIWALPPPNAEATQLGTVQLDGSVLAIVPAAAGETAPKTVPWNDMHPSTKALLDGTIIGVIDATSHMLIGEGNNQSLPWAGLGDDCDISKDRLRHLCGSSVTVEEYDRIHRFLRLWRKLGWTMVEVDAALRVLGIPAPPPAVTPPIPTHDPTTPAQNPATAVDGDVDWIDFALPCQNGNCGQQMCSTCFPHRNNSKAGCSTSQADSSDCEKKKSKSKHKSPPKPSITPDFLHQLVALKKLVDLTGLEILNLLAFWGTITTAGTPSLYSRLFLTHNLQGIDKVFAADANGNYLVQTPAPKIVDHIPILLAAFQIKIRDFNEMMGNPNVIAAGTGADLSLENVSTMYRYVLLSRVLGIKPVLLPNVFTTLQINAFDSAERALELIQLWNKITDAGFGFPQINYVLTGHEADPLHPVGPSPRSRSLLQATMTLYTGLNDIDTSHPLIDTVGAATSAAVLANAQLIYTPDVASQIQGFLDGTLMIQTNAPAGLTIAIPKEETTLLAKMKYADATPPTLQITGQLTPDETLKAKALSANTGWASAIDRCARRASTFLKTTLSGVFPPEAEAEAKGKLIKGDVSPPAGDDTAPEKRHYFLSFFIPFLKRKLADKLVIDTLAASTALDPLIAGALLTRVIFEVDATDPTKKISALDALEKIKDDPKASTDSFNGFLIPATTDTYTLIAIADKQPPDMILEGQAFQFKNHSDDDDPANRFATDPMLLTGGKLYEIELTGLKLTPQTPFSWKTDRTDVTAVPPSALLGNHVTGALANLFVKIYKCAIVINGFSLNLDEVAWFQNHGEDFGWVDVSGVNWRFDWNNLTLALWNRLADYVKLKNSLPKLEMNLVGFFTWATGPTATGADIAKYVNLVTLWEKGDVSDLISEAHFNLPQPSNFRNEINLIKIQKALEVSTKVGMPINDLFKWAQPKIDFWTTYGIAESIRTAIRARMKLSDWETAIKPTYDQLRQLQSDALTAYLINQPALKAQGIFDADGLFEFFLIDTQMCSCMETARLKQATSSVQLFVQRCFLGLEKNHGIVPETLDRGRWDWMQRYRVWEANRKVFLYPENWIQPSLRDDKSPIYLQLESELMQKDLDPTSVLEVMRNFLFGLDEVANLEVDAVLYEKGVGPKSFKIHIFARTRGTPYKWHYRYYDQTIHAWTPWQDMNVDIPRYEIEKDKKTTGATGQVASRPSMAKPGGFYIVPFTFNSRLLVALPQFIKVQLIAPVPNEKVANIANSSNADESMPQEYYEIRMGLSEFRNGKWSAKQITSESIPLSVPSLSDPLPPIGSYKFVSRQASPDDKKAPAVLIEAYLLDPIASANDPTTVTNTLNDYSVKKVGRFTFTGSHFGVAGTQLGTPIQMKWSDFHFQPDKYAADPTAASQHRVMFPMQSDTEAETLDHEDEAYVKYPADETGTDLDATMNVSKLSTITYDKTGRHNQAEELFYHPFVHNLLDSVGSTDNLDDLFGYFSLPKDKEPLWKTHLSDKLKDDAYGMGMTDTGALTYNELYRPYALYNWELGFHAPMAIVDRLLQKQQFDLALKVIRYVFDPQATDGPAGTTLRERVWQWYPFKKVDPVNALTRFLDSLRPNTADDPSGQINSWRNRPFQPHVVARLRPAAYMKFVVMKYISILIAYGDYYFRQNTLEMIPMAIQCYVLASHIYGPPGQKIPKRGKKKIQTYMTLLDKWDAFDNAMVQMEVLFPFSINQIPAPVGATNGVVGLANIFGFASTGYFCVPDNPDLRALRDTIDNRLFNIRHCRDINGIERKLPLYEPPIDPGLLVAAAAAGLSLSSVLNDLNSPLPNFRFKNLLKRALEMCEHLKALGAAFLEAKEKKDGEALMALKQQHDGVIQGMVVEQKKLAMDEANKALDGLQQSRKVPETRMVHNVKLLGEDLGSVPSVGDAESEFKEFIDNIEAPAVESGLKLIASEKDEIEKAVKSLDIKPIINAIETAASELHILPTFNAHASPLGVGVASCWGLPNIAKGIQGVAKAYQMVSDWLATQSANVNRITGFVKQTQDRIKEANLTGHEIKTIDKQIVTQQVRINVHQSDIAAQEKQTAHSQEVQEFLTSKYTNTELYTWTEQQLSSLFYDTYTVTYDLAKKTEMAFRYERGLPDSKDPPPFIKFGYWEPGKDGLLSAERLFLSLKDLEAAHHNTRGHDFEVTKHVSLRAINPIALLKLRGDANAEFAVPEILFDMDFPGHYGRRLKSVALTVRCKTVPQDPYYANVNCTLRLTSHKFRNSPLAKSKADYPEHTDQEDLRFSTTSHVPITSIATSSPTHDAGVFEIGFENERSLPSDSERFLPFEGAGAISSWRLELNDAFQTFDYSAIADVIIHLSYTSLDGGNTLGDIAKATVLDYIKTIADMSDTEGLYAVFDIPHDFPTEWAAAKAGPNRTLTLNSLNTLLPVYTKGRSPDKLTTRDVHIVSDVSLTPADVSIRQGGTVLGFSRADGALGRSTTAMSALHSTDGPVSVRDWVLTVGNGVTSVNELLILARYSITGS
ncbi:hypothetical protein GP486_004352 [Trichoglossum hirsutum]|uniref:Uncharacterized protein n=1 Tax=Trichoglossum hirsutum TaxID=265104 RepID=A0A9P8LB02_9PEZI|nr:hypothetical protein GP486_004352 [Trichoglossum hirsutum]